MFHIFSTVLPVISTSLQSSSFIDIEQVEMISAQGFLSFLDRAIKMDTTEDAEPVAAAIESFSNLTALELRGNTVGVDAGDRIAQALQHQSRLQRCLWSDMFTGRLKTEIPPILKSLCSAIMRAQCRITELDLSDNAFGPIGAEGISEFLVSPSAYSLETLKLNNNGLGGGGKIIAKCLSDCYDNARRDGFQFKLKTFIAGRNRLEDPGATALAKAFKKIGSLEEISIPQNGIQKRGIAEMAEAFQYNPNLKVINVNDNTCTAEGGIAIANSLSRLVNLEVLDLGDSLCRDKGVYAIIVALSQLKPANFKRLNLSGSEMGADIAELLLSTWHTTFSNKKIELLMSNNCLGSRFGEIRDEFKRDGIDMGDSEDDEGSDEEKYSDESEDEEEGADDGSMEGDNTPDDVEALLAGVGCMRVDAPSSSSSDELSFLDQQLKLNSAEDADIIVEKMAKQRVRVLELKGNTLGVAAGERIGEAIKQHPELERCLWSDLFTGRLKTEIPDILKNLGRSMIQANCHITELDLSDNAFGPIGAEGIQELLISPAAFSLQTLKLNNNGLGAGGKVIADCLSLCHELSVKAGQPLRLKTFVAGRNRLEVPGATALAAAFTRIGSLEEIVMPQNGITSKGIEALANSFAHNKHLRIININDNTATELGSVAIAKALRVLPNLEVVNMGDCLCRDQGCQAIIEAIQPQTHPHIKELDLSGAELTAAAASQLIQSWKRFPTAKLTISSNNMGRLFTELKAKVQSMNVDLGDSEDDQGSLSEDEEERISGDDDEDDDENITASESNNSFLNESGDTRKAVEVRSAIDSLVEEVEHISQEAAAKFLLKLSAQMARGGDNSYALQKAVEVMSHIKNLPSRPIPSSTQVINNILAQVGLTKAETKWNINVDIHSLISILQHLISCGIFDNQQANTILFFMEKFRF